MNPTLLADATLEAWLDSMPFFRDSTWINGSTVSALIHVGLIAAFFGLPAGVFIWAERKVSARIQDRLGPTRTGGRFGWLQSLADGIKLIQKEDLVPASADHLLFRVAPYVVVCASMAAYLVLPFSDNWAAITQRQETQEETFLVVLSFSDDWMDVTQRQLQEVGDDVYFVLSNSKAAGLDVGLFLLLALLALEVLGVIFAGYSSGSKWALYGAMRESAQMVSYEIPMGICALVPIVFAGTLDLNEVVKCQVGTLASFQETGIPPFLNWFVFNPIGLVAFLCYFVCATASCKRAPFDLAEAESELVAGFLTEYSGMRWSFFFLAEYASMFLVSGVAVSLFLGGWDDGFGVQGAMKDSGLGFVAALIGAAVFALKASVLVCVQIWVRWTLPRIRIDQVMTACLKYMVPIACTVFLAAAIYPLVLLEFMGRPLLLPTTPMGERVNH